MGSYIPVVRQATVFIPEHPRHRHIQARALSPMSACFHGGTAFRLVGFFYVAGGMIFNSRKCVPLSSGVFDYSTLRLFSNVLTYLRACVL